MKIDHDKLVKIMKNSQPVSRSQLSTIGMLIQGVSIAMMVVYTILQCGVVISCGEGACPRWVAKRPQNRPSCSFRQSAFTGLRLLRSRTGWCGIPTSPLATGSLFTSGSLLTTGISFGSAIEVTQIDIQATEAVQQRAARQA